MKVVSFFKIDRAKMETPPSAQETSLHVRMRNDGSSIRAVDGPFTETKEVVGGFAVTNVASKDDAVAWCRRFMELIGPCELEFLVSGPES